METNGYTVERLAGGDAIVSIRHDGSTEIAVSGPDPQTVVDDEQINFDKKWRFSPDPEDLGGGSHLASQAGASMAYTFTGNQVRLVGRVSQTGGLADVYFDDVRQLVSVDSYSPTLLRRQVLFYKNGLPNASHTLKIVLRGEHNPLSEGTEVYVDAVQYSDATGDSRFGEGGGPTDDQRMIFGYTRRSDYVDSEGRAWRPGTEFIVRTGDLTDAVAKVWWTMRQAVFIEATADPELYRYGAHGKDFTVNVTVGPEKYHVRLKFAETEYGGANERGVTIEINGQEVVKDMDIWATAGGGKRAVDVVFNDIHPKNGVIGIRFRGSKVGGCEREATVQAIEVGPGDGGQGSHPKTIGLAGQ